MHWLFEYLPLLFFVFVVYSIVSAVKRAREQQQRHEASGDETDEQRRVREIQERIRRIAAERRGGRVPADMPPPRRVESAPPSLDPFGGPLKRMLDEFEGRIQPPAPVPEPPALRASRAEVERQEEIAEQLRAAQEARALAERRAAHLRDAQLAQANPEALRRAAVRTRLLEDLREPQSLRRAVILREVLGPPVGLR